jgi:hypothetical protein
MEQKHFKYKAGETLLQEHKQSSDRVIHAILALLSASDMFEIVGEQ